MESPEQIKKLKNWACEHDIEMNFVFRSERLILNKCEWKICLDTAYNIQDHILNCLYEDVSEENKESINTWIQFALNEYSIYKQYNMSIISFACCLVGIMYNANDENEQIQLKQKVFEYMNSVEYVKDKINEVERCAKEIVDLVQNEDNDKDDDDNCDDESIALTRCNSHIDEIFDFYKENSEEIIINDNEEHVVLYEVKENDAMIYESENNNKMESFLGKKRKCNRKGC